MTWIPGRPVVTTQDHAEWQEWRRVSKCEGQRLRRAMWWRIDYFPEFEPADILRAACQRWGCGAPHALNRILIEWAERLPPE